jgi:fumarylpyruvate hydrolase
LEKVVMNETSFVFPPRPRPSIAICNRAERVPVRRVLCVGRNYAAHARELGNDDRQPPFFFLKPADAVVESGTVVPYPPLTRNLHHEIELVVVIGRGGADIATERALGHVYGYAVGIDLTRRDLQFAARDAGKPWDWGKSFDCCAPCSPVVPAERAGHPGAARIWLGVNGTIRQDANLSEMIWSVPEVIAAASTAMHLEAGDLIYTGTPAGVGALMPGDQVHGGVDGVATIEISIGDPHPARS